MTSIGSYMMRTVRYVSDLRDTFRNQVDADEEVEELGSILKAMGKIPSDLNASPSFALGSAKRILHGIPDNASFQLMENCKGVMESIISEEAVGEVATEKVNQDNFQKTKEQARQKDHFFK